ncbi:MAG: hypothetical protein ACI9F9_003180, partial [Candidatus Paceibacteria bacterium]
AVAALSTGMALADPAPGDLTRYLRCIDLERQMRVEAATLAEEPNAVADWNTWSSGVRQWFRVQCLDLSGEQSVLPGPMDSALLKADKI